MKESGPIEAAKHPVAGAVANDSPLLSVVIATYNRPELLQELLEQLSLQSLAPGSFEVVVMDDGSEPPIEGRLPPMELPFAIRFFAQPNGGAGAARHAGILKARGEILVLVDDDMEIPPQFLAAHLAQHRTGERRVVLGHIRPAYQVRPPLFERYHTGKIDQMAADFVAGRDRPRGVHLYTGNVSMHRADYLEVGGFDPALRRSEDVELGVRLEESGATFAFAPEAFSVHRNDHASVAGWRKDSQHYGKVGMQIARKHPKLRDLHPYRFFTEVPPLSRPLLAASLLQPGLGRGLASVCLLGANALEKLRLESPARKLTALIHGLDYFSGVGSEAGSPAAALSEGLHYLAVTIGRGTSSPELLKWLAVAAQDLAADDVISRRARPDRPGDPSLPVELVQRVGLQMMAAYRLMQAFRRADQLLAAKAVSRLIRHLYGADIHWDAEIAGGVHIVHGMGMAISGKASVGTGSVLCQHVTLGEGRHPVSGLGGGPKVGANVHVGPGATLLGPITIGDDCKIMPGALVMESVPQGSIVEVAGAVVRPRRKRTAKAESVEGKGSSAEDRSEDPPKGLGDAPHSAPRSDRS